MKRAVTYVRSSSESRIRRGARRSGPTWSSKVSTYAVYPRVAHLAASPSDKGGRPRRIFPSSIALCASAYSNQSVLYNPGYLSRESSAATRSTCSTLRRCNELYRLGLDSSKNARCLCRRETSRTTSQCSVTKPSSLYRASAARNLRAAWLKTTLAVAASRGTQPSPGPSDTIPTAFAATVADDAPPSPSRSVGKDTMSALSSPLAAVRFAAPPAPVSVSPLVANSSVAAVSLCRCSLAHARCTFAPTSAAGSSSFPTPSLPVGIEPSTWGAGASRSHPGLASAKTFSAAAAQCLAVAQHARAA
mmetsp:Transcript_7412/g.32702  ORF Transcript_7412/g.32702 Transcript_7412/m.32702 type:complete len:304 (-) Transcript_7412:765-1676(-)